MTAPVIEYGLTARVTAFGGLQVAGVTESELKRLSDPRVAQQVAAILKKAPEKPEYVEVTDSEFDTLMTFAYREMTFIRTNPDDIMRLFTEPLRVVFRKRFSPRDQRIMVWSLLEEKDRHEIAGLIGCSAGNIGRIIGDFSFLATRMHWMALAYELTTLPEELLGTDLLDLELNPRARNAFHRMQARTVGDLVARVKHDPDIVARLRRETQQQISAALNALRDAHKGT